MSSNIRIRKVCLQCGIEFTAKTTTTKYCGDTCSKRAYKERKRKEKIKVAENETKEILEQDIRKIQAKDILSINETCQLFGLSRTTVWRLSKSGKVKTANVGRRKFLLRSSLNELFNHNEIEQEEKQPKPIEYDIKDCFNIGEIQKIFGVSEKALNQILKRFEVPKFKKGKFVYAPKEKIIDIFGEPQ
jgi:hypothetical protein